jgi:hypothetical protein
LSRLTDEPIMYKNGGVCDIARRVLDITHGGSGARKLQGCLHLLDQICRAAHESNASDEGSLAAACAAQCSSHIQRSVALERDVEIKVHTKSDSAMF